MAEIRRNKKDQPMLDPIAYRADYSEDNIIGDGQNEEVNKEKYTGEGTNNVYHPYNETLTIDQLDPNYQYGQPAKEIAMVDNTYLSRRNDQIASALYNEGKTSREDVINFLQGQQNWFNSTEEDRNTTIDNIYKRLGQMGGENNKEEESSGDISRMESDLNQSNAGTIYGKTTADSGNPENGIQTLDDANSIYKIRDEDRINRVKSLLSMDDRAIAASLLGGGMPLGEQAMVDFQTYYPERYANVMAIKKEMIGQMNIDAISNGGEMVTDSDFVNTDGINTSYAVNNSTLSVTATQLLKSIDSILDSNDTAKSANGLMGSIELDMAKLKNRLLNLRKEANTVFKGDVPDYIVNAYINNKSQEIQNQLSILEDRYNAAYSRWRDEVSDAQWEAEMELKKDSAALDDYLSNNVSPSSANKKYTIAESNNNPTNMTVGFMQWAGAELGVDYEVSTDSFWSNGKQLYYAKLIGDPIQTTINVLNKAIAQGKNPFNTTSWKYINNLGLTVDKWNNMPQEEKEEKIKEWVHYEGGSMENMAYYVNQKATDPTEEYNEDYASYYQKLLDADYTAVARPETIAKMLGYKNASQFRNAAFAWKKSQEDKVAEESFVNPGKWTRKDGEEFDTTDTPTYDSLTYDQRNIVQQLLNLNKNPGTVTKKQYGDDFEKILSAVKEINPNWSDSDYGQADKVQREWNTSSKNGSNSRNGTAIATAMDIYNMSDKIGNAKWKNWNGMLNYFKGKFSDEEYTELLINLEVLASEYAGALKGNNAAPTEQEIADKKEILAANLGAGAMKQAAITIAKTLYNKNANEADNYKNVTLVKPPLVVTKDVADWMYYTAGIKSLPDFYQYTPSKGTNGGGAAPTIKRSYTGATSIKDAIANNKK